MDTTWFVVRCDVLTKLLKPIYLRPYSLRLKKKNLSKRKKKITPCLELPNHRTKKLIEAKGWIPQVCSLSTSKNGINNELMSWGFIFFVLQRRNILGITFVSKCQIIYETKLTRHHSSKSSKAARTSVNFYATISKATKAGFIIKCQVIASSKRCTLQWCFTRKRLHEWRKVSVCRSFFFVTSIGSQQGVTGACSRINWQFSIKTLWMRDVA